MKEIEDPSEFLPYPDYCPQDYDAFRHPPESWSSLDATARDFLVSLNLSSVHPHCSGNVKHAVYLDTSSHSTSVQSSAADARASKMVESIMTFLYQIVPPLLASVELLIRMFAFVVAPLALAFLLTDEIELLVSSDRTSCARGTKLRQKKSRTFGATAVVLLGLVSSSFILTDTFYVHEHGRMCGTIFFVSMSVLASRYWARRYDHVLILFALIPIGLVTIISLLNSSGGGWTLLGEPVYASSLPGDHSRPLASPSLQQNIGIDMPSVEAGLYYSQSNTLMTSVAGLLPEQNRTYSTKTGATPWLFSGDSRTLIPFLTNHDTLGDPPTYHRVWVRSREDEKRGDEEAVALDCAFPVSSSGSNSGSGMHRKDKPVYLVLHGLNGGSNAEYVKDFVHRRTSDGSTVCVMIARGFMDTPVRGWNTYHVARTSDVEATAEAMKSSLAPGQMLAGVGYSMGGVTLSNYVVRSGRKCHLDAAVSVSGALDMREQLTNYRSIRLWQPIIVQALKKKMLGTMSSRRKYERRLTPESFLGLQRATSVQELDDHGTTKYHGYRDLHHYAAAMSAAAAVIGDRPRRGRRRQRPVVEAAIPLLVVHALDDPVIGWRAAIGGRDPESTVESGAGNIMMLLTKTGGHVGWPLGGNPKHGGWSWQGNVVRDFVNALDFIRKEARNK